MVIPAHMLGPITFIDMGISLGLLYEQESNSMDYYLHFAWHFDILVHRLQAEYEQ